MGLELGSGCGSDPNLERVPRNESAQSRCPGDGARQPKSERETQHEAEIQPEVTICLARSRAKGNSKRRSNAGLGNDSDVTTHSAGKIAADGETQAAAFGKAGAARFELGEWLKYFADLVLWYSPAGVANGDADNLGGALAADGDAAVLVGVLDRVRQEVEQDLLEAVAVGVRDVIVARADRQRLVLRECFRFDDVDSGPDGFGNGHVFQDEGEASRFDAGEAEQIVD